MTGFEQFLIDRGYIKFILNCKTMKFEIAKDHVISTMINIDHRYFHKSDKNILEKISSNKSINDEDFTWDDRVGEIVFGLSEVGNPPTLICPRPNIKIKLIKNGQLTIENEQFDDSMNIVLMTFTFEEIFKAMYDKRICFNMDLT